MDKVRVGIIGMGGIAMSTHVPGLLACHNAQIVAICDNDPEKLKAAKEKLSIPDDHCFEDYHGLIACEDVDAVEICTPNYLHVPMALDALNAGKSVNIEKPLALSEEQAVPLKNYKTQSGQIIMLCFSYRYKSAVRYAKSLIDQGGLGRVTGIQVAYLKESALWPGRKLEWRFDKEKAGTGVLGDLGVHLIDLAQLLSGDIISVCALKQTIVEERPLLDGTGIGKVETDDQCNFLAVMADGAYANFAINRCAYGQKNTILFDVYGTEGAISFNLNDPDTIMLAGKKFSEEHPELHKVDVPKSFRASQEETFINAVLGQKDSLFPGIEDGLKSQHLLDAILKSTSEKRWVEI